MIEALVVACMALIAWTIVLGLTLPRRYDAAHWNLAWVGFDVALLAGLAGTAWAAWRRRAIIVLFATATATLMCADAWFDVTTARSSDLWVSAAQAIFVEVPFAIFLMYVVVRVLNYTRETCGPTGSARGRSRCGPSSSRTPPSGVRASSTRRGRVEADRLSRRARRWSVDGCAARARYVRPTSAAVRGAARPGCVTR